MSKTLRVLTTNKCNLSCSFCNQSDNMINLPNPTKELDVILEEHLLSNEYDEFVISGGEPFINISMLEKVLSVLLAYGKRITINTNGTYLDETILSNLSKFDSIYLQISIDGLLGEYRGLNKLIDDEFRHGFNTLIPIIKFKNKNINFVLKRKDLNRMSLPIEILSLYRIFNCPIQLLINSDEHSDYGIDDAFNFQNLLLRLNALNVTYSVCGFFNNLCVGECNVDLFWNGEFKSDCSGFNDNGCTKIRLRMKPGLYDLMCRIVSVMSNKSYTLNPNGYSYSLESDIVSTSPESSAKFKHSIDGNARFNKKWDRIDIKQVD